MYESIYKSLQRIRNKKDRADAYDAICAYALYNQEPNLETASDAVAIAFELIRPVLDSARKKAESGKQGGSKTKQDGSKPKAKGKQAPREKESEEEKEVEGEKENENEEEIEKESLSLSAGGECAGARAATDYELLSIGIGPGEYHGITLALVEETRRVTETLYKKYLSGRHPAPYDYKKVFRYCGSSGRATLLDYAFEQTAIAGKSGDWRYVDGIMDTLFCRGITTEEQARRWDEERPDLDI
jgi:hypothetical protein